MSALSRVRPDEFTTAMLATVMLGFLLPCRGTSAGFSVVWPQLQLASCSFFKAHDCRARRFIAGALHWQLHLVILPPPLYCFGRRTRFAAVVWDPADAAALSRPGASASAACPEMALGIPLHGNWRRP